MNDKSRWKPRQSATPARPEGHAEVERRTRQAFDRSLDELDPATRVWLARARIRAARERPFYTSRPAWMRRSMVVGGMASLAIAVGLGIWQSRQEPEPGVRMAAFDDLEILAGDEDLDMLSEDLDFYAWLEKQPGFKVDAVVNDGVG